MWYTMRILLLLTTLFLYSQALDQDFIDEFLEKIQEMGTVCAEETNATPDDIAELIARQLPPTTHEGKCMLFCMQKSLKLMKPDGGVDRAGAIGALKPIQKADPNLYQQLLKLFVTCGMRVKPVHDPCETATLFAICGKNEAEHLGLDDSFLG